MRVYTPFHKFIIRLLLLLVIFCSIAAFSNAFVLRWYFSLFFSKLPGRQIPYADSHLLLSEFFLFFFLKNYIAH